jgi:hypothetical protein
MANYRAIKYDLPAAANFSGVSVSNLSVSEEAVTAHEAALTITESQISDLSHTSTGNFSLSNNTISTNNGDDGIDLSISGATSDDPPALVMRKWRFSNDGTIQFLDPFLSTPLTDGTISTTKIGQWDDAYGWGDHSSAGYLTSVSLGDLSVTATASEINTLDGITATVTELNYVDGVTSAIQTQLDSKVESDTTGITGADQVTNIVSLTQAEYDAIGTPNASTIYFIVG